MEDLECRNPSDRRAHCPAWDSGVRKTVQLDMVVILGAEPGRMAVDVVDISPQDVWVRRWDLVRFQSKPACIGPPPPAPSSSSSLVVHHKVAAVSEAV